MKTYISAWPVDRQFQEKIGIYSAGYVKSISVGKTLHALINAGYTELNSFVECTGQTKNMKNINRLTIHCAIPRNHV